MRQCGDACDLIPPPTSTVPVRLEAMQWVALPGSAAQRWGLCPPLAKAYFHHSRMGSRGGLAGELATLDRCPKLLRLWFFSGMFREVFSELHVFGVRASESKQRGGTRPPKKETWRFHFPPNVRVKIFWYVLYYVWLICVIYVLVCIVCICTICIICMFFGWIEIQQNISLTISTLVGAPCLIGAPLYWWVPSPPEALKESNEQPRNCKAPSPCSVSCVATGGKGDEMPI